MSRSRALTVALTSAMLGLGVLVGAPAPAATPPLTTVIHAGGRTAVATDRASFEVWGAPSAGGSYAWPAISVDVRVSRSAMTAPGPSAWTYPVDLADVAVPNPSDTARDRPLARVSLPLEQGRALCVSSRAHDPSGSSGSCSPATCVVRFVDDGRLRAVGGVRRLRNRHFWGGQATSIRGGALVLRGVPAGSRVALLATEEHANGARTWIDVYTRGRRRFVNRCSVGHTWDPGRHFSVATTCAGRTARRGPVRLRASNGGPSVPLEGLAILQPWMGAGL